MKSKGFLLFVFMVFLYDVQCDVDTVGTNFITIFPWSNDDVGSQPAISMDFVNPDLTKTANVQLTYNIVTVNGWDVMSSTKTANVIVNPRSSNTYKFTSESVYQYVSPGLNKYPSTKVFVRSDIAISVIAHNYDSIDSSGDSFIVLPVQMASTEYAFSLPAPAVGARGFPMIYFLPTVTDTLIKFSVVTDTSTTEYSVSASAEQSSEVVMYGGPAKDLTFYASGNQPFVVVNAVRLLPTLNEASYTKDFGSFMPIPLENQECQEYGVNDYHYSDLSTTNYFIITLPLLNCGNVQAYGFGTASRDIEPRHIMPQVVQNPVKYAQITFGDAFGFFAANTRLQTIRYGGYGVKLSSESKRGAYLDNMPSLTQFVTGTTGYVINQENNQITIFGDNATIQNAAHDQTTIPSTQFRTISYSDNTMYFITLTNVSTGTHFFTANGNYMLYAIGFTGNYAFGYTSRFIWGGSPAVIPSILPFSTSTLPPVTSSYTETKSPVSSSKAVSSTQTTKTTISTVTSLTSTISAASSPQTVSASSQMTQKSVSVSTVSTSPTMTTVTYSSVQSTSKSKGSIQSATLNLWLIFSLTSTFTALPICW